MSGIPLPALSVRPPEQPVNPMEQYGRLLQMKSLMQGQQMQQQQIQGAQLENQQRQIQVQDQQAMTAAMKQWDGQDMNALPGLVLKSGGSANAVLGLKSKLLDYQKNLQSMTKDQLANEATKGNYIAQAIDNVKQLPPEQQPQGFEAAKADLVQRGYMSPQQAQSVQYQSPDQLDTMEKMYMGHNSVIEQTLKQSEVSKNTAQASAATAQAAKTNAEMQFSAGPMAEGKYRFILQRMQQGLQVSPEDQAFAKAYEASNSKSTSTSDTLGVTSTNVSRPNGLAMVGRRGAAQSGAAGVPNAAPAVAGVPGASAPQSQESIKDSIVDQIGQYRANPTLFSRMMFRHPEIMGMVQQKYPDWNQGNYNAANKAVTDLAPSGKTGQGITSYNMFLRHAGDAYDAVDTLQNSGFQDWNKPINWLKQHSGDPRVQAFLAKMQPVQKEFQSFIIGNHALYEDDRKDANALFDQNSSPAAIKAVLASLAHTGGARLSEMNNSYKRVTGRDIPNLVSPDAAAAYNKITGTAASATGGTAANDFFSQFGGHAK